MINLKNIKVVFGRGTPLQKQALSGVSLTIEEGSFVTVIGSNGAGKNRRCSACSLTMCWQARDRC